MKVCKEPGCEGKSRSRGMCGKHYEKWRIANPNAVIKHDDMRGQVLAALPATRPQLQAVLNCSRSTAAEWLKKLREEEAIHIGRWQRSETVGMFVAVHVAGPGKDAVCRLKPIPSSAYAGKYRQQKNKSERLRYLLKRAVSKQNTWLGALGVPP